MADEMMKGGDKCCEGGHHKCWCKGGLLIILAILGFLAYFNVYTLPALGIVWPVLTLILGILVLLNICCCCMKK
ncbi:MAG: hypothetical protein V1494_02095 [Candidatus Diapherotrites archaeon]